MIRPPPRSTPFPYTTLFRSVLDLAAGTGTSSEPFADAGIRVVPCDFSLGMLTVGRRRRADLRFVAGDATRLPFAEDRKSTRLNSSHANISYAVFCLKKKTTH